MEICEGGNASSLISVTERRHGVNFLRPMHDCCDKEIRLVNQLEQYDAYCVNENEEPMNDLTSIHKVASNFIANLQREGFTATTTTLLSSTSKIVSGMIKTGISCRLCDEPMEKRDFDDSSNDLQVSFLCPSCLEIRSECENFDLFDSLLL
ncbi:unnamed protein product, partial [Mesorhabditis belari]|uniref:Uncharacterized protein n=1 Tax=Mesorhabditis belari TaxID=2138241 RepID=A0AAF3F4M3_9BILA